MISTCYNQTNTHTISTVIFLGHAKTLNKVGLLCNQTLTYQLPQNPGSVNSKPNQTVFLFIFKFLILLPLRHSKFFLGLPIGLTPTNSLVICVLLQPYTLSPFVTQPYHRYLICCNTAAISSSPTRNLSVNFTLPIHL